MKTKNWSFAKVMTPAKHFGKVDIADFDPSAYDKTEKETFQSLQSTYRHLKMKL